MQIWPVRYRSTMLARLARRVFPRIKEPMPCGPQDRCPSVRSFARCSLLADPLLLGAGPGHGEANQPCVCVCVSSSNQPELAAAAAAANGSILEKQSSWYRDANLCDEGWWVLPPCRGWLWNM